MQASEEVKRNRKCSRDLNAGLLLVRGRREVEVGRRKMWEEKGRSFIHLKNLQHRRAVVGSLRSMEPRPLNRA